MRRAAAFLAVRPATTKTATATATLRISSSVGSRVRVNSRQLRVSQERPFSAEARSSAAAQKAAAHAEAHAWLVPGAKTAEGFVVERVVDKIPARGLGPVAMLRHLGSGARWLHVGAAADGHNALCVAFRTVPQDSNGVAHVLEHTVLCGSKQYPVRDPFFNMLKRSVNTYMNAWTGSDFTAYPFSTCNEKDFENLMRVYFDAAFFPTIDRWDFLQEGHRLEMVDDADVDSSAVSESESAAVSVGSTESRLRRTGVVYNEMKGAMSDGASLFSQRVAKELFAGTTYEHNSGGSPPAIASLTHEQLVAFHRKHYHPSNALIITYGDLPLQQNLKLAHDVALGKFNVDTDGDSSVDTKIRRKRPQGTPSSVLEKGGFPSNPLAADPDRQSKVAVSWRVNDIGADTVAEGVARGGSLAFESFALSVLSTLLSGGPNSPMYKGLIEPQLGSGYSPGSGYDPYAREGTFSYGLSDVSEADVEKVEAAVFASLQNAEKEGFPDIRIKSVLQQLEIGIRSQSSNLGLAVIQAITTPALHDADPIAQLQEQDHVDRLRKELADNPRFFQDMIKKYLLDNPERVTLVATPDPDFMKKVQADEVQKLSAVAATLSPGDIAEVREQSRILAERQDTKLDPSCLPTLRVSSDIPRRIERVVPILREDSSERIFLVDQPTNNLVYFRGLARVPGTAEMRSAASITSTGHDWVDSTDLLAWIPLWSALVGQLPTRRRSHQDLAQQIELLTGGISVGLDTITDPADDSRAHLHLSLYGVAQANLAQSVSDLLSEILQETDFTSEEALRVMRIHVNSSVASFADSIVSSGHSFASSRARQWINPRHWLSEQFGGLTGLKFTQRLARELADDSTGTDAARAAAHRLQQLHAVLCQSSHGMQRMLVTSDAQNHDSSAQVAQTLAAAVGGWSEHDAPVPARTKVDSSGLVSFGGAPPTSLKRECVLIPGEVSFAATAVPMVPTLHPDNVALGLASRMISSCFLHKEIREKGGAYGAGARISGGVLSMHTYRDPSPLNSLQVFTKVPTWIQQSLSARDLDEAKLSLFGDLDAPVAPPNRGAQWWSSGITPEMADERRDIAFALTLDDVVNATLKHLSVEKINDARACIVAAEGTRAQFANWDILD